ncbi:MAG: helix-turn-helix domain-containing protein [Prevotellaceae bacterium]|nr:helix-turn-helix domain-containing protein [Prevotellaceae bacterium]
MKTLSLSSLGILASQLDENREKSYVSHNLAVARIWTNNLARHFLSQPFMMNELRILVLRQGYVDVRVNMLEQRIEAGTLIFIGRYVVTEIMHVSDNIHGFVLSLSDEILRLSVGNSLPKAFNGHLQDFTLPLSNEETDFIDSLHLIIYNALKQEMSSTPVVIQLVGALIMHISYLWEKSESSLTGARTREQQLFSDFIRLVSQHAPMHHTLDFYASHLCVTPRYMSTIVSNVSGKTAKYWIDEAIVNAIKVQLRYTDKQVSEIAYDMNFPNPSFFCKYFKRLTGMTPIDYRDSKIVVK